MLDMLAGYLRYVLAKRPLQKNLNEHTCINMTGSPRTVQPNY